MIKSARFAVGGREYLAAYEIENLTKHDAPPGEREKLITLRVAWLKPGVPLGLSVLLASNRSSEVICDGAAERHDTKAILRKAWDLYPTAKETRVFHGAICCHDKQRCAVCVSRLAIEKQARKAAQKRATELAKERRTEP